MKHFTYEEFSNFVEFFEKYDYVALKSGYHQVQIHPSFWKRFPWVLFTRRENLLRISRFTFRFTYPCLFSRKPSYHLLHTRELKVPTIVVSGEAPMGNHQDSRLLARRGGWIFLIYTETVGFRVPPVNLNQKSTNISPITPFRRKLLPHQ